MLELKLLLFVQGIRFLFFDYILFKGLRDRLSSLPVISTLLKCPFCQGFWCGLFTFILYGEFNLIDSFLWAIGSAFISLSWYAIVIPKLDDIEENYKK